MYRWSDNEQILVKAFSISSGILSVLGSTTIIVILLRSPKNLKSTYRRLVFGMSCMDILHSLSYVLSGWPLPADADDSPVHYAIGNIATCNIQGFMNYTGCMGSVLYDCMLSIYFLMVVVYSKREEFFQKIIEPIFHAVSILVPTAIGIFLMATTHFNPSGNICWVAPKPSGCGNRKGSDIECVRGKHALSYRWYFQGYPLILCMIIVITCMLCLSYSIRKQLKKMNKYGASQFAANVEKKRRESIRAVPSQPGINLRNRKKTMNASSKSKAEKEQTFKQAILYVSALLVTFLFAFIWNIVRTYWVLYFLEMTFVPLLGFFNFFIFIRPRIVMTRQSKPGLSYFRVFIIAITSKEITSSGRSARRSSQMAFGRRSSQTRSLLMSSDIIAAARIVEAEELKEEEEAAAKAEAIREHCVIVSSDTISAAEMVQVEDVEENKKANKKGAENIHDLEFGLTEVETESLDESTGGLNQDVSDSLFRRSPSAQEVYDILSDAFENTDEDQAPDTTGDIIEESSHLTEDYHNMI